MNLKTELLNCVKALYNSGLNTAVSGNHSARFEKIWMWITPSEIPRYKIKTTDLVKINIRTREIIGKRKPSREWAMHREIYENTNANAIVHSQSIHSGNFYSVQVWGGNWGGKNNCWRPYYYRECSIGYCRTGIQRIKML